MKKVNSHKQSAGDLFKAIMDAYLEGEQYYSSIGKIVSVNDGEATASVQIVNGDEIPDVRLQQVKTATGLFVKPTVGSVVLVSWIDKTTCFVSMFSDVDEVVFQDGANGGLINISELTDKLNELTDKYNDLVNRLLAWVPVASDGGAALKTALTTPTPIEVNPPFVAGDYENENFKH